MTLIALQQDFLPTDTLNAVVAPSDFNGTFIGISVLGMLIFTGVVFAGSSRGKTWVMTLGTVAFALCIVAFVFFAIQAGNESADYNTALDESKVTDVSNFVSNIESVYDVEVMLPKDEDYSVTPEEKPSITVIQDNTAYSALVSQNPDTYEPTLIMVASEAADINEFRKK